MIVLAIAGLMLAALLMKYGGFDALQEVKVTTILLSGGAAVFGALLWRMQRDTATTYDALDMLVDENGRASLEAHITLIMAGLAIWWLVTQTQADKDVGDKLVDIMMIFVIYRGAKQAIAAYSKKPVQSAPDQDIGQQVIVTPSAPKVPPPRQVRQPRVTKMASIPGKTATGKLTRQKA